MIPLIWSTKIIKLIEAETISSCQSLEKNGNGEFCSMGEKFQYVRWIRFRNLPYNIIPIVTNTACEFKKIKKRIPRWQLEVGSRKRPSYSEILERRWRHTLQA
jgi:hypothetical protein